MTDEEIVEAVARIIHWNFDNLPEKAPPMSGKTTKEVVRDTASEAIKAARPLIRAQLLAELRVPSTVMKRAGSTIWSPPSFDLAHYCWEKMYDAFEKEQEGNDDEQ